MGGAMMHKILALIDKPVGRDSCAIAAAGLAGEMQADLILAVDPRQETFKTFEPELKHLVGLATDRGIPTSTMLIRLDDTPSVLGAIQCNHVDLVVIQDPDASDDATVAVASALKSAEVPILATKGAASQ
jgi:hypothetical protein